jgi:hypothetical protein
LIKPDPTPNLSKWTTPQPLARHLSVVIPESPQSLSGIQGTAPFHIA